MGFLNQLKQRSQRLREIYRDTDGARGHEFQSLSTGDPFDEFYKQLGETKDFHRRYPNEPVENLERAYKRKIPNEGEVVTAATDNLFSGEEAYGRFFDLTGLHEQYLNLPGLRGARRLSYLQYIDTFDKFTPPQCPVKRPEKLSDEYFQYVRNLVEYLEGFIRKTKPLENIDKLFASFDSDFENAWAAGEVPGWGTEDKSATTAVPVVEGTGEGIWCRDCEKEFKNDNVYRNHLTGKKHIKAAEAKKIADASGESGKTTNGHGPSIRHLKERAVAERESRVRKLAAAMQTERADTKVNNERRQGMTERERQQELEALYAESAEPGGGGLARGDGNASDASDDDDKIYNPLKLPLAWDGKPIPFWLYKLHGLGVEFACEVCGNFVYMGRRAFDKHFNEPRHVYGLKCLGITNTTLFREITGIDEAQKLWAKLQADKNREKASGENVVQMEDSEGNVMPEKVYYDLQKQGLV